MAKTKIVYAVKMLHYLPLYLAHERYLQDDFEIQHCGSDKATIDRLMSDLPNDQNVCFAVCDPMMVNLATYRSDDYPVVIAQIVQKVPFWAINHECDELHSMEDFDRFNEIYAYESPNTGYVFGQMIHKCCAKGRHDTIAFKPTKAPDAAIEGFLLNERSVLIEADILKIRKYEVTSNHKRVFHFPKQKRFQHFCFTALVTRRKYLNSPEGRMRAQQLIQSLIKASYTIYHEEGEALSCAFDLFRDRYTEEIIGDSLRILTEQEVFSKSFVVSHWGWHKNSYVRRQVASEFKHPRFQRFVDNSIVRSAYHSHIKNQVDGRYFLIRNVWDFPWSRAIIESVIALLVAAMPAFFVGVKPMIQQFASPWFCLHWGMIILFALLYFFRGPVSVKAKVDPADWGRFALELGILYTVSEIEIMRHLLQLASGG